MLAFEKLYIPHTWELTENEICTVENAMLGKSVQIDTPVVPVVFEDEMGYCLYAFLSEEAVPEEYMLQEYAIVMCDLPHVYLTMMAVEKILGKAPRLLINPFDEDAQEFGMAELQSMILQD